MKNVLVVFGGQSVEHDISVITGLGVLNNASKEYNLVGLYIDKNNNWWTGENLKNISSFQPFNIKRLKKCCALPDSKLLILNKFGKRVIEIYCVVNCLHGHNGEDGAMAGLLQIYGFAHTSSGVLGAAICMDKTMTKQVLAYNKIKVVDYINITKNDYTLNTKTLLKQVERKIGFPCIVKPNSLGSSIGVNVVTNAQDLCKCLDIAFSFDDEVLIEKYLQNARELNIAALYDENNIKVSNVEEVCLDSKLYEFNDKYKNKNTKRIVPADIEENLQQDIINQAIKAYKLLKCNGVVRFDFLYALGGPLYLNEVNTVPGSLAGYLFKTPKIKYNTLITKLIEEGVTNFNKTKQLKYDFESGVLQNLTQSSFKMIK